MTYLIPLADEMGCTDDALRACERAIDILGQPGGDKLKQEALRKLRKTRAKLEEKKAPAEPALP